MSLLIGAAKNCSVRRINWRRWHKTRDILHYRVRLKYKSMSSIVPIIHPFGIIMFMGRFTSRKICQSVAKLFQSKPGRWSIKKNTIHFVQNLYIWFHFISFYLVSVHFSHCFSFFLVFTYGFRFSYFICLKMVAMLSTFILNLCILSMEQNYHFRVSVLMKYFQTHSSKKTFNMLNQIKRTFISSSSDIFSYIAKWQVFLWKLNISSKDTKTCV